MVTFHEETHTYKNTNYPELVYISSTTLVGLYKSQFEAFKIATAIAKRDGISRDVILEGWAKDKDYACKKGTLIHKYMEAHILGEPTDDIPVLRKIAKSYDKAVESYVGKFGSYKTTSEMILSDELNEFHGIAGMADLVFEFDDGSFMIGDFKTNKKFEYISKYDKNMKEPLQHLEDCHYNTYSLQLSLYALLYSKMSGKKFRGSVVFFLKGSKWVPLEMKDLRDDVKLIVNRYYAGVIDF